MARARISPQNKFRVARLLCQLEVAIDKNATRFNIQTTAKREGMYPFDAVKYYEKLAKRNPEYASEDKAAEVERNLREMIEDFEKNGRMTDAIKEKCKLTGDKIGKTDGNHDSNDGAMLFLSDPRVEAREQKRRDAEDAAKKKVADAAKKAADAAKKAVEDRELARVALAAIDAAPHLGSIANMAAKHKTVAVCTAILVYSFSVPAPIKDSNSNKLKHPELKALLQQKLSARPVQPSSPPPPPQQQSRRDHAACTAILQRGFCASVKCSRQIDALAYLACTHTKITSCLTSRRRTSRPPDASSSVPARPLAAYERRS